MIGQEKLVMLNTDMSLYYNMDMVSIDDACDDCYLDARKCGFNLETMFYAKMFAEPSYHEEFVKTFVKTYAKMLSAGPVSGDLLQKPQPNSARKLEKSILNCSILALVVFYHFQ